MYKIELCVIKWLYQILTLQHPEKKSSFTANSMKANIQTKGVLQLDFFFVKSICSWVYKSALLLSQLHHSGIHILIENKWSKECKACSYIVKWRYNTQGILNW
jgi:hypothetical protein